MALTVMSWNVENFAGSSKMPAVAQLIQDADPAVFALYEIKNLNVLDLMRNHFPNYSFHITDGPQVQEILVGYRLSSSYQAAFTQKREFKAGNEGLRPGALLTVRKQDKYLNMLFLHTDSGTDAAAFGNRHEMFNKVWKMKAAIDKKAGGNGSLLVAGDLNTMGLFFPTPRKADKAVGAEKEITALENFAEEASMSRPVKEFDLTFDNGKLRSDLDHFLVSNNLKLKKMGTRASDGRDFHVAVRGWAQLSGAAKKKFIAEVSDHCALIVEVNF